MFHVKRSGPLQRKTPLQGGKPLERRSPLRSKPRKPKPLKRERMDPDLRAAVVARARGRCEHCGKRVDPSRFEAHHRKLRTRGGEDSMENLIAVPAECHREIHANPAIAHELGHQVHSWDDPKLIPVRLLPGGYPR